MADRNPAHALDVIRRVEMMCDFIENPAIIAAVEQAVPVCMPRLPGALGFDVTLWVGLGMAGLWAALDKFSETAILPNPKCVTCAKRCMPERFTACTQGNEGLTLEELEDFRHLYAHNYAGEADDAYFARKRHVLKSATPVQLTCGAQFDGRRLQLDLRHLRTYSQTARNVLRRYQ